LVLNLFFVLNILFFFDKRKVTYLLDSPHRSLQKTRGWDLGPQGN